MKKVAGQKKFAVESAKIASGMAAILLACAACPALASTDASVLPVNVVLAEAKTEQAVRVQVDASSVPRIEAQDSGFQSSRVDVSLFPARSPRLGAMVGMSGFGSQQQPLGLQPVKPSVDLGLRYSHPNQPVDVMAWRRMNVEPDAYTVPDRQPVYGARVEMNLAKAAAKSGFALDKGFLGFQLESGARISIKRKDGRPMIYYRNTF